MAEKEDWMKLNEQGKQKHMGCDLTPQELLQKLTQGKTKKWEEKLRAAIKEECGGMCVLVCKQCNTVLSANNPSKSFTNHKSSGAALAKAAALRESPPASPTTRGQVRSREEDAAGTSSMEPAAKKAGPLDSFTVKPAQAEQVHRMLAIHVIKKERSFEDLECPAPRKAFATVGVKLKGEKAFRTTW